MATEELQYDLQIPKCVEIARHFLDAFFKARDSSSWHLARPEARNPPATLSLVFVINRTLVQLQKVFCWLSSDIKARSSPISPVTRGVMGYGKVSRTIVSDVQEFSVSDELVPPGLTSVASS